MELAAAVRRGEKKAGEFASQWVALEVAVCEGLRLVGVIRTVGRGNSPAVSRSLIASVIVSSNSSGPSHGMASRETRCCVIGSQLQSWPESPELLMVLGAACCVDEVALLCFELGVWLLGCSCASSCLGFAKVARGCFVVPKPAARARARQSPTRAIGRCVCVCVLTLHGAEQIGWIHCNKESACAKGTITELPVYW